MHLSALNREVDPPRSQQYPQYLLESEHDEPLFEGWLQANPAILLDEPVFIFARQPSIESGTPDLLGLDQYGNLVVFEIKTGKSGTKSASEESIIGQPLTYAQTLAGDEYGELDDLYQLYREQVRNGHWDASTDLALADTLQAAFAERFGRSLSPDQYNAKQRVVIVAEHITRRTAENARYLLEQGYNIQCQEVQFFEGPNPNQSLSQLLMASSTVVDYPLRDVRPTNKGHPAYPELNREILDRTHLEIGELVDAERPRDLVQGFDERQPRIRSPNPDHPDSVSYRLYVNPEQETILVALDISPSDEAALAQITDHQSRFIEDGFEVTGNSRHRVVIDSWLVEDLEELDDETLEEIAQQYAALVRAGHEVFDGT